MVRSWVVSVACGLCSGVVMLARPSNCTLCDVLYNIGIENSRAGFRWSI